MITHFLYFSVKLPQQLYYIHFTVSSSWPSRLYKSHCFQRPSQPLHHYTATMSMQFPQIIKELDATRNMLDERTRNIHHHLPLVIQVMRHPDRAMTNDEYLQWEYGRWRELYILLSRGTRSQYVFATLLKVVRVHSLDRPLCYDLSTA